MNVINKLVTTILYEPLSDKLEPLLREEQAGFRPHRFCVDQINTLRIVAEQSLEYRSTLYVIFVDFYRALRVSKTHRNMADTYRTGSAK